LRSVIRFGTAGAALPVIAFLLSASGWILPLWILVPLMILCPPYVLFIATAACSPFDACSMSTLGAVAILNLLLYSVVGFVVGRIRLKRRAQTLEK
jgi:hypothetical protein